MDLKYDIMLNGICNSFDDIQVVENIAVLFKCSSEEAKSILSVPRYMIKRNVPRDIAIKYKNIIEETGALCVIELVPDQAEAPVLTGSQGATVDKEIAIFKISENEEAQISFDEAAKIFIGGNYKYFFEKWVDIEFRGIGGSWNWAAFFWGGLTGIGWLFYRRMYAFCFTLIFIVLLIYIFCLFFIHKYNFLIISTMIILTAIYLMACGWLANSLYKWHVERHVRKILVTNTPEEARFELARRGGTEGYLAIPFVIAIMMLSDFVNEFLTIVHFAFYHG